MGKLFKVSADKAFYAVLVIIGGSYVLFIVLLLIADLQFTSPGHIIQALQSKEIQYSLKLSLLSCTLSMLFSLIVGIPLAYVMTRLEFFGKRLVDTILDIPVILPPLVIGLSLLIFFQTAPGSYFEDIFFDVTYAIPGVILAQFVVACAFATRTLIVAFKQVPTRAEQVALTLGCNHAQAFYRILLPQAKNGIITAAALAWARSFGEFGPILIFAGATRMRTEVLSTSIFLEMSVGHIEVAVAISLMMLAVSFLVLILIKSMGEDFRR